jgi:CelD/BcsL family acetyltransferase involved in cellulose biosynthesis
MVEIVVKHPLELTAGEESQWQALRSGANVWRNPFFSPAFCLAVARLREDGRVALVTRGDELVGVWPFHLRPLGLARPIGAPLSDWHGPIFAHDLTCDPGVFLTAAGAAGTRFAGLADPFDHFVATRGAAIISHAALLHDGADALIARLNAARPAHGKNMRRRFRKAEREAGAIGLVVGGRDPALFAQMLAWKRAQYAATGKHDVLASPWVQSLLRDLVSAAGHSLRAEVFGVTLAGRLAAVELFLREGDVLHAWFPAYDPAFAGFSPGHLLTELVVRHAAASGVTRIEFGPGEDEFKRAWSDGGFAMYEAVWHAPGLLGRLRAAGQGVWAKAEARPLAGKIRRRLDMIVAAEADWGAAAVSAAKTALKR